MNVSQALQMVMAWGSGACKNVLGDEARKLAHSKKRKMGKGAYDYQINNVNGYYLTRSREWAQALGVSSREYLEACIKLFKDLLQTSEFWRVKHFRSLPPELWNNARALSREVAADKDGGSKDD